MILLADSGSTKTEWMCVSSETIRFTTIGLNPYFADEDTICMELREKMPQSLKAEQVEKVFFYGSGCGSAESKNVVRKGLQRVFTKSEITVETDLVGAAIACYGAGQGVVAILGTGMNIGYWNGKTVETPLPSLGYVLGDAGSGAVIGRRLLRAIYEQRVSQEIIDSFREEYHLGVPELLNRVYKQPRANRFLAQFVPFVVKYRNEPAIQELLQTSYREFAEFYVKPVVQIYNVNEISIVGSLSVVFQEEITQNLREVGVDLQKTIANPLDEIGRNFEQRKAL